MRQGDRDSSLMEFGRDRAFLQIRESRISARYRNDGWEASVAPHPKDASEA